MLNNEPKWKEWLAQLTIRLGSLKILLRGHRFESYKATGDFPGYFPGPWGLVEVCANRSHPRLTKKMFQEFLFP